MISSINKLQSHWQLQDAKSKFSMVVKRAETGEPQMVTRNGVPTVYIVDAKSFERLSAKSINRKEILRNSPCKAIDLDIKRHNDEGREVIL